jgi:hypothetical protein
MWAPVFTVLFVLAMSLVVVRVATIALILTGVSRDLAQFQALSAFTRCGFSTRESEGIVNHPIRRRIVMHLMLLGNAGIVIAIASVLSLFIGTEEESVAFWLRLLVLCIGTALLWVLAASEIVERLMRRMHVWALKRWTRVEVRDYTGLLRVAKDFTVSELRVRHGEWLQGQTLAQLQLPREGVIVLGIERSCGTYVGTPRGDTVVESGDSLILYGRQDSLLELDTRQAGMVGNLHHVMAVTRQINFEEEEEGGAEGEVE